jgi:hypothetical protein
MFFIAQVQQPQLVLGRRLAAAAPRAVKDEEAELDRIVKEANQGDVWDNELVGNALKVRGWVSLHMPLSGQWHVLG